MIVRGISFSIAWIVVQKARRARRHYSLAQGAAPYLNLSPSLPCCLGVKLYLGGNVREDVGAGVSNNERAAFRVIEGERRWVEGPRPFRLPERQCVECGRRRLSKRCACGARASVPLLDARPILLSEEVRRALEKRLTDAFRMLREDPTPSTAEHLRHLVLPHLVGRLSDHRRADRMKKLGLSGYREFHASIEAQVAFLVAVPPKLPSRAG